MPAILIFFDQNFFFQLLEKHHVEPIFLPEGSTADSQPLDLVFNACMKTSFSALAKRKFSGWNELSNPQRRLVLACRAARMQPEFVIEASFRKAGIHVDWSKKEHPAFIKLDSQDMPNAPSTPLRAQQE